MLIIYQFNGLSVDLKIIIPFFGVVSKLFSCLSTIRVRGGFVLAMILWDISFIAIFAMFGFLRSPLCPAHQDLHKYRYYSWQ